MKFSEMNKVLKAVIILAAFLICMALIIFGQKQPGMFGLMQMIAGIAGLITMLYFYNKPFVGK